jgi:hypothetical protein
MNLHILYRLKEEDAHPEKRPLGFSKENCMSRFMQTVLRCHFYPGVTFVVDGNIPGWMRELSRYCPSFTAQLDNIGNGRSFWAAYEMAIQYPEDDWVYFVEDDYMHDKDALEHLYWCIQDVRADFITLYDHPDRYKDLPEHNLTHGKDTIYVSRSHHWRTVPSTTMTFAASVRALAQSQPLFEEWTNRDSTVSWELFPRLVGLRGHGYRFVLVGAIPTLATHCEVEHLAPFSGETLK